jgi:hypothetical protein
MIHSLIRGERDVRAGSDGDSACSGAVGADVAAEVVGGEIGHWRVVVGVLPDVLV